MTSQFTLEAGLRGKGRYLYELECIRGLAILLVFLFHAYGATGYPETDNPGIIRSYLIGGNTGVTLFFVLSGFLLSLPWLKQAGVESGPGPSVRNYYLARFLRIVPLYYAAILFAVVATGAWTAGVRSILFIPVGFDMFPYSVVWWTLATEVQFYLLLPLLFWLPAQGNIGKAVLLCAGLLWLLGYLWFFVFAGADALSGKYWVTRALYARLPAFLVGIFSAWVYLKLSKSAVLNSGHIALRLGGGVVMIAALLALGLLLQEVAIMGDKQAEVKWHIHHFWEALVWAVLVLSLLFLQPLGRSLLVNRPLAILGKLSYSIYLNHVPILFLMIYSTRETMGAQAYFSSWLMYLVPIAGLVASVILAYCSYRLIELPFLNLKHRIPV
ncbi:MAG: acyltransferase [Halioglobus sp.]